MHFRDASKNLRSSGARMQAAAFLIHFLLTMVVDEALRDCLGTVGDKNNGGLSYAKQQPVMPGTIHQAWLCCPSCAVLADPSD